MNRTGEKNCQYIRAWRQGRRESAVAQYGGRCAVCGESRIARLTIDHVNNDGASHRRLLGGVGIVDWLIRNHFPPGFQVLCWNHNRLKQLESYRNNYKLRLHAYPVYKANWARSLKSAVIDHYGDKCVDCGETSTDLLTVEHINGNGQKHRNDVGKGIKFYRWVIDNCFPTNLTVKCWNCNCGGQYE